MVSSYDARVLESRWFRAWDRAGCYRAPDLPCGPKYFNYDSGPFPNGPLHMGHVRTYLLGDVTARYQRALGKSVLYCTEWDAFGLPIELEAVRQGMSPAAFTRRWVDSMARQMRTLGISYDWSRVRATCDPAYYRWTQWLFLKLRERGLVERRETPLSYCPRCETTLSRMQVEDARCWRCETPVETRRLLQWFVLTSRYARSLLAGLDRLQGWSPQVRSLVRGIVHARNGRGAGEGDWLVSRQRCWGTPIPILFCWDCGTVPVPEGDLPVRLPEDLDWSLGPRALSSHESFVQADCPRCGKRARRETDTLDCFFDDVWCMLACLVDLDAPPSFVGPRVRAWMPVDRFHSGFDTVSYLHLHRFLAAVLHENDDLPVAEPIAGHVGHEMVLAGRRKMSKHLGNAVSPSSLIRAHGADALRVAMLWAAGPHVAIRWSSDRVAKAASWLADVHDLYSRCATAVTSSGRRSTTAPPTKAVVGLQRQAERAVAKIGRCVEEYRPNAAVEELAALLSRVESFALRRIETARMSPSDRAILREILEAACIALSLFAPHLAEEHWHAIGNRSYVVQQRWPTLREVAAERRSVG